MRQEELPLDDPRLDPPETIVVRSYVRTRPAARKTDPAESHEAAARVAPSSSELCQWIRAVVHGRCLTQFDIAAEVAARMPGVWREDTIRSACSRAGLVKTRTLVVDGRRLGVYTDAEHPCGCVP